MEFSIKAGQPGSLKSACLIVTVAAGGRLGPAASAIDAAHDGVLRAAIRRGDVTGRKAQAVLLANGDTRIVAVGMGKPAELDEGGWIRAVRAGIDCVLGSAARDAVFCLDGMAPKRRDARWQTSLLVQQLHAARHRPDSLKSKRDDPPRLTRLAVWAGSANERKLAERGIAEGRAIGAGADRARALGNLPGNVCTPRYLGEQAVAMGNELGLQVEVFDETQIAAMGMGSFLSVARGSVEPPRFIVMRYNGGKPTEAPVALIGKGVTFDTGGISIKPSGEMDEMKYDMCGAASVFGALHAAATLELPLNVVGVIPATENMPGGKATKPGDIVTSMSGQTIEILNTDAEGRLILCDALTYTERHIKPAVAVDIATLTGACVIALGHVASGLYSQDERLAKELLAAGDAAWDRAWRMPLWSDYHEQLKSNFADMGNIGGRPAGSVTAACFLAKFAGKMRWAHLDIAGTAWVSGKQKGATGRPVALLSEFLIRRAGQ